MDFNPEVCFSIPHHMRGSTGPSFLSPAFVGQPLHINEEQLYTTKGWHRPQSTEDTAESHYVYLFFLLTILSLLMIILAFISTGQLEVLSNTKNFSEQ